MRKLPLKLERAEFRRTCYFHMAVQGVPLAEVMKGDYWVHVRNRFQPNDLIEVVAEDGAYDAVIRILSINTKSGAMTFRVLSNVVGKAMPVARVTTDRFEIKDRKFGNWSIYEIQTGTEVVKGLSKDEAVAEKARLEGERKAA